MTQGATPRQTHTAPSSVESDLPYEVVDGQIVEKKPMGAYEILIGSFLNTCLDGFARANNCGRAISEMLFDFGAGLSQRRPDVAYVSYDRWSRHWRVPRTQAWPVVPELAARLGDPVLRVHVSYRLGQAYMRGGDYRRAAEVLRGNMEMLARSTPGHMRD